MGQQPGGSDLKAVAAAADVEDGDEVDVSVQDGAIVIRPAARRYTIEEVRERIRPLIG